MRCAVVVVVGIEVAASLAMVAVRALICELACMARTTIWDMVWRYHTWALRLVGRPVPIPEYRLNRLPS